MEVRKMDGEVVLLILGGAVLLAGSRAYSKTPFDSLFEEAAKAWDVPSDLLRAFALHESGMKPEAVSKPNRNGTRDYGLMQINERTGSYYNASDLLNPAVSIAIAARFLADLRKELRASPNIFSDFTWIASYNAGSPAIRSRGIFNLPYVLSVLGHWSMFALGNFSRRYPEVAGALTPP